MTRAARGSEKSAFPLLSFQRTLASRYGALGILGDFFRAERAVSRRRDRAGDRAATRFPASEFEPWDRSFREPLSPRAERDHGGRACICWQWRRAEARPARAESLRTSPSDGPSNPRRTRTTWRLRTGGVRWVGYPWEAERIGRGYDQSPQGNERPWVRPIPTPSPMRGRASQTNSAAMTNRDVAGRALEIRTRNALPGPLAQPGGSEPNVDAACAVPGVCPAPSSEPLPIMV